MKKSRFTEELLVAILSEADRSSASDQGLQVLPFGSAISFFCH